MRRARGGRGAALRVPGGALLLRRSEPLAVCVVPGLGQGACERLEGKERAKKNVYSSWSRGTRTVRRN